MKFKKLASAVLALSMTATAILQTGISATADSGNTMRDMSTMEIVNDMGIGINLGNTFEACGDWIAQWGDGTTSSYETAWGSPVVTQELIQGYANAGFDSLRIPVAWSNMMADDGNYQINSEYMTRVNEVVDWALDAGLYVIVNLHWDYGWLEEVPTNYNMCIEKYTAIWTQVADNFKDYGDYLIFESQNEELGWSSLWNQWAGNDGKEESYQYVNAINQKFVDIIRNSGGNNPERHLLISGYNTGIDTTCDALFKMPNDPASRCAVSVHYYSPATFAILEEDADWGKASSTWGTEQEYADLNSQMDLLKTTFVDNGIPVIIGEYGCPKKNKEEESVRRFLTSVCECALSRGGICPVLWDVTDLHYDRTNYTMIDEQLHSQFLALKDKYVVKTPDIEQPTETTETTNDVNQFIIGDVNADSEFSMLDIVMMQKWLSGKGNLKNWKAGDLDNNGLINIYDFCLMKNLLLRQNIDTM
ncbi:MAG: cellulase family glycosylhydrolase [Oscillospiraceae bacterium]|nr:cellulase family glycosylhydrolase [Oscillospiraceae bacterium]